MGRPKPRTCYQVIGFRGNGQVKRVREVRESELNMRFWAMHIDDNHTYVVSKINIILRFVRGLSHKIAVYMPALISVGGEVRSKELEQGDRANIEGGPTRDEGRAIRVLEG